MGISCSRRASVLAYDNKHISTRCFPLSGKDANPCAQLPKDVKSLQISADRGIQLECVWTQTKDLEPNGHVLVHFHGNGELAWQTATMWADVFHEEFDVAVCFFVEYRGYGTSTGTACLCAMQHDFDAIMHGVSRVVKGCGGHESRLLVYGRSIGTVFALAFASRYQKLIAGLILESGICNISEWVKWYASRVLDIDPCDLLNALQIDKDDARTCEDEYLNAGKRLRQYGGPLLILHTAKDRVVSVEHARAFHKLANARPNRLVNKLVVWEEGGHNDIHFANMNEYLQELKDFAHIVKSNESSA